MADIRTGPEAADAMASWSNYSPRMCLQAVSRAFQRGTPSKVSEIDPIISVNTAIQHWNKIPAKYKTATKNVENAPKGTIIQCGNGEGHIFISMGGGRGVSTDFPSVGKIGVGKISDILKHFSGNPVLGTARWINGRPIKGIEEASKPTTPTTGKKSVDELAREVLRGDWGNGEDRRRRLTAAGYNYNAVQGRVNQILDEGKTQVKATRKYTVRPGDNLSAIASKFGIRGGWKELYNFNKAVIGKNPNLIRPGMVLRLPS